MELAPDLGARLVDLVQAPGFVPLAFVLAFAAGAAHALAPGHGKSLAAAYLVGSGGRVRDAAWLGGSVAVMHTVSVLVIGVAWTFFSLSDLVSMPRLTAGLQLVGGLMVVAVGAWLLARHLRADHGHGHDQAHGHDHAHGHHHHGRTRAPSRPGLVLLGMSGGLTPSPAAFMLLITGMFTGRAGFALALVMTFGLGLASVLFGVGLLALRGRDLVTRATRSPALLGAAARVAPVVAAVGITVVGLAITSLATSNLVAA